MKPQGFWKRAIIFSFVVNVVLLLLLIVLALVLWVKLDHVRFIVDDVRMQPSVAIATIASEVPVDGKIAMNLKVPVSQEITLVTTRQVALRGVRVVLTMPNAGGYLNGTADIDIPAGTPLAGRLDTTIPVNGTVAASLTGHLQKVGIAGSDDPFRLFLEYLAWLLGLPPRPI